MSEIPKYSPEAESGSELEPGEPRHSYALKIFTGFHGFKEDFEALRPLLEDADVYIPENYAWDKEYVE